MDPSSDLQLVPETLLKRRHDLELLKARRAASALSRTVAGKRSAPRDKSGAVRIVKPETILAQSRQRRKSAARYNRVSRKGMQKRASAQSVVRTKVWDSVREQDVDETDLPTEKEDDMEGGGGEDGIDVGEAAKKEEDRNEKDDHLHKISYRANSLGAASVFVVLLRPTAYTSPRPVRKTLSSLRLRRVNEGVFLPYTPATRKMLHLVEPYVLYGILSAETVSDLVRRRGFCRLEGKRVPLTDNNVIERELGGMGLICVEDLVQVLSSRDLGGEGGLLFGTVAKFLWPFRLTSRKSKFQKRMLDLKDGKLYGDQGDAMNGYIREML